MDHFHTGFADELVKVGAGSKLRRALLPLGLGGVALTAGGLVGKATREAGHEEYVRQWARDYADKDPADYRERNSRGGSSRTPNILRRESIGDAIGRAAETVKTGAPKSKLRRALLPLSLGSVALGSGALVGSESVAHPSDREVNAIVNDEVLRRINERARKAPPIIGWRPEGGRRPGADWATASEQAGARVGEAVKNGGSK